MKAWTMEQALEAASRGNGTVLINYVSSKQRFDICMYAEKLGYFQIVHGPLMQGGKFALTTKGREHLRQWKTERRLT